MWLLEGKFWKMKKVCHWQKWLPWDTFIKTVKRESKDWNIWLLTFFPPLEPRWWEETFPIKDYLTESYFVRMVTRFFKIIIFTFQRHQDNLSSDDWKNLVSLVLPTFFPPSIHHFFPLLLLIIHQFSFSPTLCSGFSHLFLCLFVFMFLSQISKYAS